MIHRCVLVIAAVAMLLTGCSQAAAPAPSLPASSPVPGTAEPSPLAAQPTATAKPVITARPAPSVSASPSPSAKPSPSPASPKTGATIYVEDAGFSIHLPNTWLRVSNADGATDAEVAAIKKATGGSTATVRRALDTIHDTMPAGLQVYAFRLKGFRLDGQFATSMNVVRIPGSSMSLGAYGRETVRQLEGLTIVSGAVTQTMVELPAGTVLRFSYDMDFGEVNGARLQYRVTQYLFLDPDDAIVITLGTKSTPDKATLAEFVAMARSFKKVKST